MFFNWRFWVYSWHVSIVKSDGKNISPDLFVERSANTGGGLQTLQCGWIPRSGQAAPWSQNSSTTERGTASWGLQLYWERPGIAGSHWCGGQVSHQIHVLIWRLKSKFNIIKIHGLLYSNFVWNLCMFLLKQCVWTATKKYFKKPTKKTFLFKMSSKGFKTLY